jgi:hypothetical protein
MYVRGDDRATMVELEPHVAVSLKVARALGLVADKAEPPPEADQDSGDARGTEAI